KDIGKRLAPARPLRKQKVAEDDSVLGPYANDDGDGRGLATTYKSLIQRAFQPAWWDSDLIVVVAQNGSLSFVPTPNRTLLANEYSMLEYNFPLFFGLAIQVFEMTLISDDAPVDRFFDGNTNALTAQQKRGLEIFKGDSACSGCHVGPETTDNSVRILLGPVVDGVKQPAEIIERMFNGNCEMVVYDQGNYNISVRPTEEDLGRGNLDPFGNPFAIADLLTRPPASIPSQELLTIPYPNIANPKIGERVSTQGTFKVPNLRNVALTAPYFHNGGQATLRQVVEFYNRGGDFREHNSQFIDFEIGKLNLTSQNLDDLVSYLQALTDERVVRQSAPFDHPQLFVPNGHKVRDDGRFESDSNGILDVFLEVSAVGRRGGPLPKGFLEP